PQRANLSAVYALFGVVLIPVSFSAIRLAKAYFHPQVFTLHGPNFGGWILVTYCIAQAAMLALAYTLYRLARGGKQLDVRPRRAGRAATWGVRLGWLAQTALLAVQATRDDGFPWGTWAGSLTLFVWLVVSAYLIWGCRRPYRLLGLVVMPLAVALLVVARAGGGTGIGSASRFSNLFL